MKSKNYFTSIKCISPILHKLNLGLKDKWFLNNHFTCRPPSNASRRETQGDFFEAVKAKSSESRPAFGMPYPRLTRRKPVCWTAWSTWGSKRLKKGYISWIKYYVSFKICIHPPFDDMTLLTNDCKIAQFWQKRKKEWGNEA